MTTLLVSVCVFMIVGGLSQEKEAITLNFYPLVFAIYFPLEMDRCH